MNAIEDSGKSQTDALTARLAREVMEQSKPARSFTMFVSGGVALAAAGALSVVLGVIGYRSDLAQVWLSFTFLFKIVSMSLAVVGSISLLRRSGTPGMPIKPIPFLAPALVALVAGAVFDNSGFPIIGRDTFSVLRCVGSITLAALPALVVLMLILRRGVPTDLVRAGAVAGGLAGSLGALAYALACVNDGFAFVALWYAAAITLTTAVGAILGPHALAW